MVPPRAGPSLRQAVQSGNRSAEEPQDAGQKGGEGPQTWPGGAVVPPSRGCVMEELG